MRTAEQRQATRLRKKAVRDAHRAKVWARHPARVRYAKAAFKKGKKHAPKKRQKLQLGIQ
jgi:hypothetical protein